MFSHFFSSFFKKIHFLSRFFFKTFFTIFCPRWKYLTTLTISDSSDNFWQLWPFLTKISDLLKWKIPLNCNWKRTECPKSKIVWFGHQPLCVRHHSLKNWRRPTQPIIVARCCSGSVLSKSHQSHIKSFPRFLILNRIVTPIALLAVF